MADQLKLSEPGNLLSQDPATREYLRCYGLPAPPEVRYGSLRFDSPEPSYRVGLFGQAWLPVQAEATVLFIHGFCEHTGNYGNLITDFVKNKLAVLSIDLRGHGFSEGPRGHVDSPQCYLEDLEYFLKVSFPALAPNRPLHIWAHSLGALLALQLITRKKLPVIPASVVVSSPFLGFPELKGSKKIMAKFAPLIAKIMPTLSIALDMNSDTLSHDLEYLAEREKDPLIFREATPQWLISVTKLIQDIHTKAEQFPSHPPTLFMLAGDELVTNLSDARRFAFNGLSSIKHKVIEFPRMRHELEKEKEIRGRVVKDSIAWMLSHS
jgi:alpha-beta hydrolase superfamily lysophospholipase